MAKIDLLFPVETTSRELDFRLFLAAYCVAPDIRIFIGHWEAIYRLSQSIYNGIYVGKNIFIHLFPGGERQLDRYHAIKNNGFRLVHLDEEGGVMKGDKARWKSWLSAKLDPAALEPDDFVCTWGRWQRDYYRSLEPACAPNICVTGHPRFDLYKPHLQSYFAADAKSLQERLGDFVLINTNFAWANNRSGIARPFSAGWNFQTADVSRFVDHVEEWGNNSLILTHFVKLVARLSTERPDLQFVLRPHPSENIDFYRAIFNGVKNVHVLHEGSVGAWLLACRALVHDGCTTAIEAHFAGTPIITYKPVVDPRYDLLLPNLFGEKCFTAEDVLSALDKTSARVSGARGNAGNAPVGSTSAWSTPEVRAMDDHEKLAGELIANFEINSLTTLRDVIAQAVEEKRVGGAEINRAPKHQAWKKMRRQVRTALGFKARSVGEKDAPDKFSPFEPNDIACRIERVQQLLGVSLQHRVLCSEMMTIESSEQSS